MKKNFSKKLNPVYKAIQNTRKNLDKKIFNSFIGAIFWTLLVYMLNIKKK